MLKTKKFDFKKILTLILALTMCFMLTMVVACNKNQDEASSSSSSSAKEETVTDYQLIKNGDFEFGTNEKTSFPYNSSSNISWTRSNDSLRTSSDSSTFSSGIIDTQDEAYNKIAKSNGFTVISGEGDSAVYYNPRTPYYYGLVDNSYEYSKTQENDDKLPTTGTKILMIHNKTSNSGVGTAQKFTSSSTITVGIDSYSLVEVWVLTNELKTEIDRQDFGAYVMLTNNVGGEKAPYIVKNINTNGNWAKISIYVEGSSLRETSYKMVLGLGFGSSAVTDEYVEGYAYFDNVTAKEITKAEFETAQTNAKENVSILEKNPEDGSLVYDYKESAVISDTTGITFESNGEKSETFDSAKAQLNHLEYTISYKIPSNAIPSIYGSSELKVNYIYADSEYGKDYKVGSDTFANIKDNFDGVINPLGDSQITDYMILNGEGTLVMTTPDFNLGDGEAVLLTCYIKVKTLGGQRALTLELEEKGTPSSQINESSTLLSNVSTVQYKNDNTNDWAKAYIYVTNHVGDSQTRTFSLKISFGPTDKISDNFYSPTGYALLTGYEATYLSEDQADNVSNSLDYSAIKNLGADLLNAVEDEDAKKDSYNFNYSSFDKLNIENKLSTSVIDYSGVVVGHKMIGGDKEEITQAETKNGIFNTKYIDNYSEFTTEQKDAIKSLEKDGDNEYLQAIAINNTAPTAYGYIGKENTISSQNSTQVSVKLKVLGDAKAYVYLVDSEQLSGFGVLGLSAKKWEFNEETKETTYLDEDYFDSTITQYVQVVTAKECGDGWAEVNFVIYSGISSISYRIEVWNGARDGSDNSQGLVIIDNITTVTPDENALILKANSNGDTPIEIAHKQAPTKVTYTDEDGNEQVKYKKYNSKVIFTNYPNTNTIIATHATINAEVEADETTNESKPETPSDDAKSPVDLGLQISSMIIAIVLVIALIAVFIRLILKNKKKKVVVTKSFYDKNSRDKVNIKIAKNKKAKKEAEALKRAEEAEQARKELEAQQRAEAEAKRLAEEQASQDATERQRIALEEQQKALEAEIKERNQQDTNSYDYDNMENNIESQENDETPSGEQN